MKKFFRFLFLLLYIFSIGEIGLRIVSSFANIAYIERLKYAKKLTISSENINLSHEHKPNSKARLMGVNINLNSFGHRSEEISINKPKNEHRIHIIGSSLILGWGVEEENTFSKVLEKKLNSDENIKKKEKDIFVINGGISNTNTQNHLQLFKNQFIQTKPDTFILGYFVNDAEIISKKKDSLILKYSYFSLFIYQQIKSYFFKGTLDQYYVDLYEEEKLGWVDVQKSVLDLKNLCKKNNINFVILLLPSLHSFSESNDLKNLYTKINNKFLEMNVSVVNTYNSLSKAFGSNPSNAWIANDDTHPNAKAHEIIANNLYNHLLNENII